MQSKIGQVIQRHIEEHISLYLFIAVLFFMGIIFGTLIVHSLGYNQRADLFYYFQQFLVDMDKDEELDFATPYFKTFFIILNIRELFGY